MNEPERIAAIAAELDAAAQAGDEPRAVLQSGAEVVECARLAANRTALYRLAAVLLRATLQHGRSVTAASVFDQNSEYYLTDVVMDEDPRVVPEVPESAGIKAANVTLAAFLIGVAVFALIGVISFIVWLL